MCLLMTEWNNDMKKLNFKRTLVLGAHSDDEFGCIGTMIRLLKSGLEVYYAVFSTCEESVPSGYPKDILAHEVRKAAQVIGLTEEHLLVYDYRVRHFPALRQDILEDMIRLKKQINPELVLLPAFSDIHQDHYVIAREGLRAFKFASVLGYELPTNTIGFEHACFIELKLDHIQHKLDVLRCYESQQFRPYMKESFVRSLAIVRGVQAGVEYAEAFEVLRLKL